MVEVVTAKPVPVKEHSTQTASASAASDNKKKNEIKKLRNQLEQMEGNISSEEKLLKEIQESMAHPEVSGNYDKLMEIEKSFHSQKKKLEVLQNEWESLVLKIEALEHLE